MFVASTNSIKVHSAGEVVNPQTTEVMASTAVAPTYGGRYICWVTIATTAAAQFDIQHRNAANDGNISGEVITVYVPADDTRQFVCGFVLLAAERVRVVPNANITGTSVVAINYQRIS